MRSLLLVWALLMGTHVQTLSPLEPGDIILSRRDPLTCHPLLEITCHAYMLYNGYWMHNAIVVEQDGELKLVNAVAGAGVTVRELDSPYLAFASDVAVIRVDAPESVRRAAADYALAQVGKPFSWRYTDKTRTDAFYCSQLAWQAYAQVGINLDANELLDDTGFWAAYSATGPQTKLGALALTWFTVSPDDLMESPHTFVVQD